MGIVRMLYPVVFDHDLPLRQPCRLGCASYADHETRSASPAWSPAPTNNSRTRVSCGDSAPPSTFERGPQPPNAATPGYRSATAATSAGLIPVALSSASRIGTVFARQSTPKVKRRSCRGCHPHPSKRPYLIVSQPVAADDDPALTVPTNACDLCGRCSVEPFRTQHRGRGSARQHRTCRQPSRWALAAAVNSASRWTYRC